MRQSWLWRLRQERKDPLSWNHGHVTRTAEDPVSYFLYTFHFVEWKDLGYNLQCLLLALCKGIIPGGAQGNIWCVEDRTQVGYVQLPSSWGPSVRPSSLCNKNSILTQFLQTLQGEDFFSRESHNHVTHFWAHLYFLWKIAGPVYHCPWLLKLPPLPPHTHTHTGSHSSSLPGKQSRVSLYNPTTSWDQVKEVCLSSPHKEPFSSWVTRIWRKTLISPLEITGGFTQILLHINVMSY